MTTDRIEYVARYMDMSDRFAQSSTVVASPAAGSITTICSLTIPTNLTIVSGVYISGWCAYTVGTNGVSVSLAIRQTNTTGTVVATTGLVTRTATNLNDQNVQGFDATPGVAVYVLCMLVTSGSASSAVSAANLTAIIV
jgi:hypothetical protein